MTSPRLDRTEFAVLAGRFRQHYRGRHAPMDALWWLVHPEAPTPAGTPPAQEIFITAADGLRAAGCGRAADALLRCCAELVDADRAATLQALDAAGYSRPGAVRLLSIACAEGITV